MVRTDMCLLLGLLLLAYACPVTAEKCADCNITKVCCEMFLNESLCSLVNASKAFVSSSTTTVNENDNITLTCSSNIPPLNVTYEWFKDESEMTGRTSSWIVLDNVLPDDKGNYGCCVKTACGNCLGRPFSLDYQVDSTVIFIVCAAAAVSLIVIMGVVMKLKLKKDSAKHKERQQRRAQQNTQQGY